MVSKTNIGYYKNGILVESVDTAEAWANISQDWAVSEELVDDPTSPDYSSKHYAEESHAVYDAIVIEGDTQVARVIAEGDTQIARVITEGDTQKLNVIAEGDTQTARVIAEGDTQTARAKAEADRAEVEADRSESAATASSTSANASADSALESNEDANRAEAIANTLDDALRNGGFFNVSTLAYPTPSDQTIPFTWFCLDTGDVGDGIIWSEGDMLEYVPHSTDPVGLFGFYYRVAGELAGGVPPTPQPITILDDLIMFQDKKIIFQTAAGTAQREVLHLDTEGDIVLGQHDTGGDKVAKIGLAATEVFLINELDPSGVASVVKRIAPEDEVDAKDVTTLASANAYTDSTNATQDATIALKETIVNVDSKDATTLASANSYTDSTNATQDAEIALKDTIVSVDAKIATRALSSQGTNATHVVVGDVLTITF